MAAFVQRDVNANTFNLETVDGDAGGVIAKVSLKAAVESSITSIQSSLTSIAGYLDGVEGFVDGVEALIGTTNSSLTTLQGFVDGVETLIGTTNSSLAAVQGYVDGLETLIGATNSGITALQGYVDGLEGYVDTVEAKLDTLHVDLGTTLAAYLSTLAGAVTSNKVQAEIVTLPAPNSAGPVVAQSTVGTSATQLASQACKHGVWLRNVDSTKSLAYGNGSGLTLNNGYLLYPREEKFIPVANQNQIWIVGSASSTAYCTSAS